MGSPRPPADVQPGAVHDLPELVAIDQDAGMLYLRAGLNFTLPPDHPFLTAESTRWRRAASSGGVWIARVDGLAVGFAVVGTIDGGVHLDQLAVRGAAQRRGVGRALIEHVQAGARGPVWLTTYAHFPWNAPFYVTAGFRVVDPGEHGPEVRATLVSERAALPLPDQRVAMRWDPPGSTGRNADGERGSRGLS